jgi:hypothetical protein
MNTDVEILEEVQLLGRMSVFLSPRNDEDEVLVSVLRGMVGE